MACSHLGCYTDCPDVYLSFSQSSQEFASVLRSPIIIIDVVLYIRVVTQFSSITFYMYHNTFLI